MTRCLRRILGWTLILGILRRFRTTRRRRERAAATPLAALPRPRTASPPSPPLPVSPAEDAAPPESRPWWRTVFDIGKNAWTTGSERQVGLLAAGVAFYAFLSLVPALIATITIYGLIAKTSTIESHAERLADAVPESARQLVLDQVTALATTSRGSLSVGLILALFLALWSASGAVGNLMKALNVTYGVTRDERSYVTRRLIALGLTAGIIVGGVALIGLVAVFPAIREGTGGSDDLWRLLGLARWVVLAILVVAALTVVFRVAPDTHVRTSWTSPGALAATAVWLIASWGFSYYVANLGSYGATYGSLASVVVLLLWFWLSFFIVLLGASINAEITRRQRHATPASGAAAEPRRPMTSEEMASSR